jgi:peptidoglycan-N-acetylglucosamine deacetylase
VGGMSFKKELAFVITNLLFIGLIIFLGITIIHHSATVSSNALNQSLPKLNKTGINEQKKLGLSDSHLVPVVEPKTSVNNDISLKPNNKSQFDVSNEPAQRQNTPVSGTVRSNVAKKSTISQPTLLKNFKEIYRVPKGYCALTFDDGPTDYSMQIAELLKENNAPATFFVIGENVNKYPSVVKYESQLGFSVQDHSETHPVMARLSAADQTLQILQVKNEIEALTNKPVTLFRPPYGSFNTTTKEVLVNNHMQMALWNEDPRDWSDKTADELIKTISQSDLSGMIIDLHDKEVTYEALPQILQIIKSKDLKLILI